MNSSHPKLILIRHGQSIWNQKNLFTGWVDIPMSQQGIDEAYEAGKKIKKIPIDVIFTSTLFRAQMTIPLVFLHHESQKIPVFIHEGEKKLEKCSKVYSEKTRQSLIPVYRAWELNERMYGQLQGLNKAETAKKFGEEQVHIWRRSFDVSPPEGESLKMTAQRTLPYFKKRIVPFLKQGKNVLISAHGNSLRSIVMEMLQLSEQEIVKLEIPTGDPLIYTYKNNEYDLS